MIKKKIYTLSKLEILENSLNLIRGNYGMPTAKTLNREGLKVFLSDKEDKDVCSHHLCSTLH